MKMMIPFILSAILLANIGCAQTSFIVKEQGKILEKEGDCCHRYSPMSTFKIVLSLIGFDSGILINENNPIWPFKQGYVDWRDSWMGNQTPESWIKESCVWYSQVLTHKLGMEKFQDYVTMFDYGNKDLSGDFNQNNGLAYSWLCSSLLISSEEQVTFLQKVLTGQFPINSHSVEMTKKILFIEELENEWKLYGKTGGTGYLLNDPITEKSQSYHGWFIGWIEKENRQIIFSNHIDDKKRENIPPSLRAKEDVKKRLIKLINSIEKK